MTEFTEELRDRVQRLLATPEGIMMVPETRWVRVMNLEGISNSNVFFRFAQNVAIHFGGKLTLIARDAGEVLVRYEALEPFSGGTQAPTGAIFFLPEDEFDKMSVHYHRRVAEIASEKQLISELLASSIHGCVVAVPEWQWVHIQNLQPISNANHVFKFDENGGIDKGGTLQMRGRDGDRLLVEYTAPSATNGTSLPTGSIFFISVEDFEALG